MQKSTVKITLVAFSIIEDMLTVYMHHNVLPTEIISDKATLEEQVEEIFHKNLGFALGNNYVEQLYTISPNKNEIAIVYYVLVSDGAHQEKEQQNWLPVLQKTKQDKEIISYALQRLRWKIEYTNVVYSLLPKTFTLSDLQKAYEIILGKKLDKRNFRKKILSLHFLKATRKKRIDNARPAQMYTFTKRTPQIVKVF